MLRDGRDIANGKTLSRQVCVIGSGPAGLTAALELHKQGIKVVVIEGSRAYSQLADSWPDKVALYNGQSIGLFRYNEPDFLILPFERDPRSPVEERERIFGGTSTHWGGQTRPQDPLDLAKRSPRFSGWPVTREELDPFYERASNLFHLHGPYAQDGKYGWNFSNEFWEQELGARAPKLDGFDVEVYQFVDGPYKDFSRREFDGKTIAKSKLEVIRNASLLCIEHEGRRVRRLRVASMEKEGKPKKATEFTIEADAFVLACGAVDNARQLLLSKIGNEHDQVGRNFLCHPLAFSPVITVVKDYLTQSERNFTNGSFPGFTTRLIPDEATTKAAGGRCWFWPDFAEGYLFEQAPNPKSRVMLSTTCDKVFGQPETCIDWQLSDLDEKTYKTTTRLFAEMAEGRGGKIEYPDWPSLKRRLVVNGHHLGTTRMSHGPQYGVVDPNLKVHSMDNLFVAGSSVFSTAGISNPTFTIVALSMRLADHLVGVLRG